MIDSSMGLEILGRMNKLSARGGRAGESLFSGRNKLAKSRENRAKIDLEKARISAIIELVFLSVRDEDA
jgi:hypothetical protein